MLFKLISFLGLAKVCQPSGDKAHCLICSLDFFIEWVTINERFSILLNFLLSIEERPASVQIINSARLKSFKICFSKGFKVVCSLVLPGFKTKASGIPFPSISKPIWTIGLGRCSLETPYCFKPSSCSTSKK